jgi:transcriptional regulator with XRE-family HTH domain
MARSSRTHLSGDGMNADDTSPRVLTKQQFGAKLYRLMVSRGWNQSELARRAGLQRDSISTYVNGRSFPTPLSLQGLARAFEMTPEQLLPNYAHRAIQADSDITDMYVDMKVSPSDPKRALLRINQMVPRSLAVKILSMLETDDAVSNGA